MKGGVRRGMRVFVGRGRRKMKKGEEKRDAAADAGM